MAAETDWNEAELRAAVRVHHTMLRLEAAGVEYSKTDFRRGLRAGELTQRSEGSIEYRLQNISYVMEQNGLPRIEGYKPSANVGPTNEARLKLLIDEVALSEGQPSRARARLRDIVPDVDALMGVKAVFGAFGDPLAALFDRVGERGPLKPGLPAGRKPRTKQP